MSEHAHRLRPSHPSGPLASPGPSPGFATAVHRGRSAAVVFAIGLVGVIGLTPGCGSESGSSNDAVDTSVTDSDVTLDSDVPEVIFDVADTVDTTSPDIVPGGFGAACQGNQDCTDGYCVEGEFGFFCTRTCDETCPDGFDCRSVLSGSADPAFLCLPRLKKVCVPCKADYQCTGGACLTLGDEHQCAPACSTEADCPTGYGCLADPEGTRAGKFCQPRSGTCSCTPELAGGIRTCTDMNNYGVCYGTETCDPEVGWTGCNAKTPAAEVCDRRDNDCNALVDDGVESDVACSNTVEGVGTCTGQKICVGVQGYVCTAATPSVEVCDFRDNDCDGLTDEGFVDANGAFTLATNCGSCGNDCTQRIVHGTGRCEIEAGNQPVCVVDQCDPDYVPVSRFQCALPPDVSCQPCTNNSECYGGTCTELDGQKVCVVPCGDSGSCQEGYTCRALGGADRCVPVTDSCVCSVRTNGQVRTCSVTNQRGVCFGQEICDATRGWTGCSAATPAVEVCNGIDDDCNGRADDGVTPPTAPCAVSVNGVGTCGGLWLCQDPDGSGPLGVDWKCNAPTPVREVCNFLDDNCDGVADDTFKDAQGRYVGDDNCGSCGVKCTGSIPNATATCRATAASGDRPRCEVLTCAPGYYQANATTCLPVSEDLCAPCATDSNCPTPGDKCLSLDGGKFCGRDCAAGNLHGTAAGVCPSGYRCDAVGGGQQCVPTSGSCSCLAADAGRQRTCLESNALGTCYGQETCNPATGWSACSARVPGDETCNGVDDDCNSAIDDVPGRGAACSVTNGFGTCPGVRECAGAAALVCQGRVPAAEKCNYEDDNCNGSTDEGFAGLGTVCTQGAGACQRFGVVVCDAAGTGTRCNATAGNATAEKCNGVDDDCDGSTDEDFPQKGQVCETGVGACKGFGTRVCSGDGSGTTCNAVAVAGSGEACDLTDNDCDGQTDEDFKNGSGQYATNTTCGNCFTNCTTIFARPNANGSCNSQGASPVCQMVCTAGYFDLNGVPDDGCEFQLEAVAVYVAESDANAKDDAGCGGGPSATGGGRYPCKSITQGLARAGVAGSGKTRVLVAGGAYNENVTLRDGISVFGGYNAVSWSRNSRANLTAIFGVQTSGHRKTVVADGITASATTFDGFTVYGQVANGVAENSYAIWVRASGSNLKITNNVIWPGSGGPGQNGTGGTSGQSGGRGGNGTNAFEPATQYACYSAACEAASNTGGAAGTNASCAAGTAGGAGGTSHCPDYNENSSLCTASLITQVQTNNNGGGVGSGVGGGASGIGGCDSVIDKIGTACDCSVPTSTAGGCALGPFSSEGGNGQNGTAGAAGVRNASAVGAVNASEWLGFGGGGGGAGTAGAGGGGGGAGGGVETYNVAGGTDCPGSGWTDYGGSGGGGGAGGCGGNGGGGGGAGGGAFGIFVVFAANPGANVPVISGNDLHLGFGGQGGRGGEGGTAGKGGNGGLGGAGGLPNTTYWCANPGSKGGEGGEGGPGGGGAGGSGGVAYGLYASGGSSAAWAADNTFFSDGAGGAGGQGGGTGPGGNVGQAGLAGTATGRNF